MMLLKTIKSATLVKTGWKIACCNFLNAYRVTPYTETGIPQQTLCSIEKFVIPYTTGVIMINDQLERFCI